MTLKLALEVVSWMIIGVIAVGLVVLILRSMDTGAGSAPTEIERLEFEIAPVGGTDEDS